MVVVQAVQLGPAAVNDIGSVRWDVVPCHGHGAGTAARCEARCYQTRRCQTVSESWRDAS